MKLREEADLGDLTNTQIAWEKRSKGNISFT